MSPGVGCDCARHMRGRPRLPGQNVARLVLHGLDVRRNCLASATYHQPLGVPGQRLAVHQQRRPVASGDRVQT